MNLQLVFLLLLLSIAEIGCLTNLITDPTFESLSSNLNQVFIGLQSYSFKLMPNGQSDWYSRSSPEIVIRESVAQSSTVMETLNNNTYNKICQDITGRQPGPYQLSFDYYLDANVHRRKFAASFNGNRLLYQYVLYQIVNRATFTVYLSMEVNMLCFQCWSEPETLDVGVLVDNVLLAQQDVRVIHFTTRELGIANYLELVSNETVADEAELQLFQQYSTLSIANCNYRLDTIGTDSKQTLTFTIEILSQYGSSQTQVQIALPTHRNPRGQLIAYTITADNLPRYMYGAGQVEDVVGQVGFYLDVLARLYNVCDRVVRVVGFAFVGVGWMGGYYLGMFLGFLDVHFVVGAVRDNVGGMMAYTINTQTIGFFANLTGYPSPTFGSQHVPINQSLPPSPTWSVPYTTPQLSPNLLSLLADNLLISLFNTLKILLLFHIVFKDNARVRRILRIIRDEKILLDYIVVLPTVVFVAGLVCRAGGPLFGMFGKVNRALLVVLPILVVFFPVVMFLGQVHRMDRAISKVRKEGKPLSMENQKTKAYYRNRTALNLTQSLMFFIVPALVSLNQTYTALIATLLLSIFKLVLRTKILLHSRSFMPFLSTISSTIEIALVLTYLIPHLIESFPVLSPSAQINWMAILRYNSLALMFLYVCGGFIEVCSTLVCFFSGFRIFELTCKGNKVDNLCGVDKGNQIKIAGEADGEDVEDMNYKERVEDLSIYSDIKTVNQLKEKVGRSSISISKKSMQQISNPFIKSPKKKPRKSGFSTGQKQNEQKQRQNQTQNPKQEQKQQKKAKEPMKMTKVITMKHIEVAQLEIGEERNRTRVKSSYQPKQNAQGKELVVKKPRQASNPKTLKLIKKLELPKPNFEQTEGPDTFQNIFTSNFEKEENFS